MVGVLGKPMSIIRAICKSDLKDLTIVTYGGPDVGLLCSAKKVKKLIFGFVSLDIIPLDSHFRKARQAGEIKELMEIDEGMLQWGLRAAAMRLPFYQLELVLVQMFWVKIKKLNWLNHHMMMVRSLCDASNKLRC
ncbi:MAG: hypothetical protein CM15mP12_7380 [Gammaproteobacteria bacterium]|nr:MAG: hypothetical protein CM15mP12_7380 [Gammaproteobacteria bacterium]